MKTLETEFTSKGFHFRQIAREGMKAIYHRRKSWIEDWEVILIRSSKAGKRTVKDKDGKDVEIEYEESESYPSSWQWGIAGWTYTSEEEARKKFETLKA